MAETADDFRGTERYELVRKLGGGGMGVVWEARDRDRDEKVALKLLRHLNSRSLLMFKQEFRALVNVTHPNLVTLYDLTAEADRWFFTMELVVGTGFLEYVRVRVAGEEEPSKLVPVASPMSTGALEADTREVDQGKPAASRVTEAGPGDGRRLDEGKLRLALRQVGEGLHALHAKRRLHLDIKPSNVLVTRAGRVVICDFGLVQELTAQTALEHGRVMGTIGFMSPEQAAGERLTEASDWYSVGVMLYAALSGRMPFTGSEAAVLRLKQTVDPVPPTDFVPGVPADLDALCMELLARDPASRPSEATILERLGAQAMAGDTRSTDDAPFVGREEDLLRLQGALEEASQKPIVVLLRGRSGMGKTELCVRFLSDAREKAGALVLRGRCYERESVPYKAFDSVIDALGTYVASLPRTLSRSLLPEHLPSLARLFPVLENLVQIADGKGERIESPDPHETRKRAFAALRELFRNLAQWSPIVVYIDDLQWGDRDSGQLLLELLRHADSPPLLLLASYRSEEEQSSSLLRRLLGKHGQLDQLRDVRTLEVDALPDEAAQRLVEQAGGSNPFVKQAAESITREAAGSPFLLQELVRYVSSGAQFSQSADRATLADVLRRRTQDLPPEARTLLATIAVASRPIPIGVASQAGTPGGGGARALALLRTERLVRTSGATDADNVETYHDRIREFVVDNLPPQSLTQIHEQLAMALERSGHADPEALVEHWLGAGDTGRASKHAAVAAAKAGATLAFDRAARLYRQALSLGGHGPEETRALKVGLAEALASAGRGPEAADAYMAALDGATVAEALELRRKAAEELLQSGHLDRGLEAVADVLNAVGEKYPATPGAALVGLLARRALIGLRGNRVRERAAADISSEELARVDILWSVASGVSQVDTIRGINFQSRHLLRALACGEPYRVARGLAMQSTLSATGGGPAYERTMGYATQAMALAERIRHPHAIGFAHLVTGVGEFLSGHWRRARDRLVQADTVLRGECTNVQWELDSTQLFLFGALFYLGELRLLGALVPERLREAEERGDLFGAVGIRSWRTNMVWLVAGDPTEARRQVDAAHGQWSRKGFHLQHYYELLSYCQIDLYEGNTRFAWERIDDTWRALTRSMLLRVQNVNIEGHYLRARCAIAHALATNDTSLLSHARRDARAVAAQRLPWARALAALASASIASLEGDTSAACTHLTAAMEHAAAAQMSLHVEVARACLGSLLGDAALTTQAHQWMTSQSVHDPTRLISVLAPGKWGHSPGV